MSTVDLICLKGWGQIGTEDFSFFLKAAQMATEDFNFLLTAAQMNTEDSRFFLRGSNEH